MGRDPAFLFYDGDAARDVSHMNRLERGCYFDIIQAQRKFGRMKEDLIKKILGKDFDTCWENVKICMTYVDDMFFIAWLEDSSEKRKMYSLSRSTNRKAKLLTGSPQKNATYVQHMENEIENEIVKTTPVKYKTYKDYKEAMENAYRNGEFDLNEKDRRLKEWKQ